MLDRIRQTALFKRLQPSYHLALAFLAALRYGFPSKKLVIIGVTGTKGKSSVVELTSEMLRAGGLTVATLSTIHFQLDGEDRPNRFKMTMPGRFFVHRFLREAVDAGCTHAVLEMSSEGAKLWRHAFVEMNALIFTNLTPEHIEAHGSFEKYKACKLRLRDRLIRSKKERRYVLANRDSEHAPDFLDVPEGIERLTYALEDVRPYHTNERGVLFTFRGESVRCPLVGEFAISNILAALRAAEVEGVSVAAMKQRLATLTTIKGRAEHIDAGQDFTAIVDYAHTAESLEALYTAFTPKAPGKRICVLGNTGGGRDTWKRPKMAAVADRFCDHIILTNEDPYDEDPRQIVAQMEEGIEVHTPEIIMDRRQAIRHALTLAQNPHDVVLVTGKGTDPYIMGPGGSREEWSDAAVVQEELEQLDANQKKMI
ncbi:UDP-N-acetylmuramyl-tripeptide synthetase [Patescibacteria group bacterium]|jgi:UDP-N-acetylmuramoyl-L-alanyl-D-glutamate--2,6-diaminopimelate ligase|nr:UDP-N-acetylmuramyl-tripeptide synthetase [Patescibacteria group bacterium]